MTVFELARLPRRDLITAYLDAIGESRRATGQHLTWVTRMSREQLVAGILAAAGTRRHAQSSRKNGLVRTAGV